MDDEVERLFREGGLADAPHVVDEAQLLETLRLEYGLDGRLVRIPTEKDATYRLRAPGNGSGEEFLVKVSQPEEPEEVVGCQVDVVSWVEERDPGIPVQSVLSARDGKRRRRFFDADGRFSGVLRVHRFIPGSLLVDERATPRLLRSVGAMLGRLDIALGDFSHPGETRVFVWDLERFMSFEPLIASETDPIRRALAQRVFDAFGERVVPALPAARKQVIHGDFSPYNVVVDPDAEGGVTGVIDFGDAVRGPVVFDPAVLLGNHLLPAPNHPWEQARQLLDGYRERFPLSEQEVGLTAIASVARVTLRALIAARRLERGTDRADYVMQHAGQDWDRVDNAISLGFDAALDYLLHT